jgi:hypothetical protein
LRPRNPPARGLLSDPSPLAVSIILSSRSIGAEQTASRSPRLRWPAVQPISATKPVVKLKFATAASPLLRHLGEKIRPRARLVIKDLSSGEQTTPTSDEFWASIEQHKASSGYFPESSFETADIGAAVCNCA